ncbi:hypothetical protein E7T06_09300 [Deinococcus sp. Arct2-2]|uniref:hypothetical protein n=1 Tax=Deinococcus sp. Arct2-2 TaxID=2568653 RepID=UPI0010A52B9D|nr:hypothetical protein [Deinococcus sp. Arct2-2]THF69949.1 hypothetical protein E7T06_09300 [Deinococcus sp. Arct2-2]
MKKLLLGLVGLSAALASCGVTVDVGGPVTITALNSYTSDWYRNVPDGNGGTKPEYVICDNRDTTVVMNVSWVGTLAQLDVSFEGSKGGKLAESTGQFTPDSSGNDVFTYMFGPNMAPLSLNKTAISAQSLKPQAIIVNPTNKGTTFVTLTGYSASGLKSNSLVAPQGIPVVDCI